MLLHARWRFRLVCFVCLVSLTAWSQKAPATVSFMLDFPGSLPEHYGLSISSDGHASYVSDGKIAKDAESDQSYALDFTVSQATADKVFDLARQANYFQGNLDSKKKNIASTGDKVLTYKDAQKNTAAGYNYSTIPAVQELTTLFQNISATVEFGHRLDYDYRYQKLALDQETKAMEDAASHGQPMELGAIAPILKKIVDDPSVINGVRARLERMLENAGAAGK